MFVLSAEDVVELKLVQPSHEPEKVVNGVRYACKLWKEVMVGLSSLKKARENARFYLESPFAEGSIPLVVEKNGMFSIYLSDNNLQEYRPSPRKTTSFPNVRPKMQHRGQRNRSAQPKPVVATFRGRPIA